MSVKVMMTVQDSALAASLKPTALALARFAGDDGGNVYPALEHVAWLTGKGLRQTRNDVTELLAIGVLTAVTSRRGGLRRTTLYRINVAALPKRRPWREERAARQETKPGSGMPGQPGSGVPGLEPGSFPQPGAGLPRFESKPGSGLPGSEFKPGSGVPGFKATPAGDCTEPGSPEQKPGSGMHSNPATHFRGSVNDALRVTDPSGNRNPHPSDDADSPSLSSAESGVLTVVAAYPALDDAGLLEALRANGESGSDEFLLRAIGLHRARTVINELRATGTCRRHGR